MKAVYRTVSDFLLRLAVYQRGRQRLFDGIDQLLLAHIGGERGGILTRKQQQQTATHFWQVVVQTCTGRFIFQTQRNTHVKHAIRIAQVHGERIQRVEDRRRWRRRFSFGGRAGGFLLHTPVTVACGGAGREGNQHQQRDPDGTLAFFGDSGVCHLIRASCFGTA